MSRRLKDSKCGIVETRYIVSTPVQNEVTIALISDLHNAVYGSIIKSLEIQKPDFIAVNGDLLYASSHGKSIYYENSNAAQHLRTAPNAVEFLNEATKIGSVIFSTSPFIPSIST